MSEEAVRTVEQAPRFLPRRLAARLDERHMPATPILDRLFDELMRPARRMRLGKTLAPSRKLLLPGLTVVVPTRNRGGARLSNLLASLERQSARDEMRVIVVDYGSNIKQAREIAGFAAEAGAGLVRVDADDWNRSAALNVGLRRALTKFVLVADADLVFDRRYVEEALGLLRRDARRIIVSAMHDLPDMPPDVVSRTPFAELQRLATRRYDARYHPSIIAVHCSALAAIGGYDEGYRGWGLEDVDVFTRLRNAGLHPVRADERTGYVHQWHPKYLGLTRPDVEGHIVRNRNRFDRKRLSRRHGQRKAIVTAAGPRMWRLLEHYALPTFWRFAERFGYNVLPALLDDDGQGDDRGETNRARWAKLPLLREAAQSYDIVVWLDADVMIRRFDDDIASHLAADKFQAFTLEQVPQDRRINPNTGVWVMRGGSRAVRFLRAVERAGQQPGPWADQAAVMKVLGWDRGGPMYHGAGPGRGSRFLRGTGWLPPSWNQLYAVPGEDATGVHAVPRVSEPHALHFAGMSINEREAPMRRTLERVMAADLGTGQPSLGAELETQ